MSTASREAPTQDRTQRLAVQMFMLRRSLKADFSGTLDALQALGCNALELYGPPEDFTPAQARRLRAAGMQITGRHVEWAELQPDRIANTLAYLRAVECPIAVVPCLGGEWHIGHSAAEECRDVWLRHADALNALCEPLRAEGLRLGYHTHNHEFQTVYDGQTVFSLLFERLQPDVALELDTGRALMAGADPVTILRGARGRDVLLHLKPHAKEAGRVSFLGDADDANDLPAILSACRPLWRIVESEYALPDEMENVRRNLTGLKRALQG